MRYAHSFLVVCSMVCGASLGCDDTGGDATPDGRVDVRDAAASPDGPSDAGSSSAAGARERFWEAFHGGNYGALEEVIAGLEEAVEADPSDPRTALLLAHAHLWTLAEWDTASERPPENLPEHALGALRQFATAAEGRPDDARIPGWLGAMQMAVGEQTGNDDLVQEGRATLDGAVERFPEFNLFIRAAATWDLAADDPGFAAAPDALWETIDRCAGEAVDRDGLEYFADYGHLETDRGPKRVCWNGTKAPHNIEGFFLILGDVLVKAGDIAQARGVFENVPDAPDYGTWGFRATIEERLEGDLEARAALYRDGDPDNDPPIGGPYSCMVCHAE